MGNDHISIREKQVQHMKKANKIKKKHALTAVECSQIQAFLGCQASYQLAPTGF